jgi:hypothetical protein
MLRAFAARPSGVLDILCRLSLDDAFNSACGRYWDNDAGDFGHIDLGQVKDVMDAIANLAK